MAATANKGKKKKWGGGKRREIKVNTVFLDKKEHAKFSGEMMKMKVITVASCINRFNITG